ncbi:unnamed protein product [Lactuca saligna]|uniref:Uncharacterized protein n=1 Tax=Lactuca saligna TaxID=75948 RepID=A0AA36E6D8_LACSI|nr:unnamed protein product [Lactuca saligna]
MVIIDQGGHRSGLHLHTTAGSSSYKLNISEGDERGDVGQFIEEIDSDGGDGSSLEIDFLVRKYDVLVLVLELRKNRVFLRFICIYECAHERPDFFFLPLHQIEKASGDREGIMAGLNLSVSSSLFRGYYWCCSHGGGPRSGVNLVDSLLDLGYDAISIENKGLRLSNGSEGAVMGSKISSKVVMADIVGSPMVNHSIHNLIKEDGVIECLSSPMLEFEKDIEKPIIYLVPTNCLLKILRDKIFVFHVFHRF